MLSLAVMPRQGMPISCQPFIFFVGVAGYRGGGGGGDRGRGARASGGRGPSPGRGGPPPQRRGGQAGGRGMVQL